MAKKRFNVKDADGRRMGWTDAESAEHALKDFEDFSPLLFPKPWRATTNNKIVRY